MTHQLLKQSLLRKNIRKSTIIMTMSLRQFQEYMFNYTKHIQHFTFNFEFYAAKKWLRK